MATGAAFQLLVYCLFLFQIVASQELSDDTISKVRNRLEESALLSWELGTRAQAITEHDAPAYSVFTPGSLPPPQQVPEGSASGLEAVYSIAQNIVSLRGGNIIGAQPLMEDGSSADPASNGVAVSLAAWTGVEFQDYEGAAQDQLDFLLQMVPRTPEGAISHRVSEVSLWSDYIYMVPPFLAYFGVMKSDESLILEAYNQIKVYRDYLRDPEANNLWKHITPSQNFDDPGHWSTGNGWAAGGMLRVLATIQNSEYDSKFANEKADLIAWVKEIHDAVYSVVDDTRILRNYVDNPESFYDAAATALVASTVYRVSILADDNSHIIDAERARQTLFDASKGHIDSDGWLTPVVNPHWFSAEGEKSAEGQAFVLLLQAAYKDWVSIGSGGRISGAVATGNLTDSEPEEVITQDNLEDTLSGGVSRFASVSWAGLALTGMAMMVLVV